MNMPSDRRRSEDAQVQVQRMKSKAFWWRHNLVFFLIDRNIYQDCLMACGLEQTSLQISLLRFLQSAGSFYHNKLKCNNIQCCKCPAQRGWLIASFDEPVSINYVIRSAWFPMSFFFLKSGWAPSWKTKATTSAKCRSTHVHAFACLLTGLGKTVAETA